MVKRVLMNASVASMIYKFNMCNIEMLENMGYQVDVACNFGKDNPISKEEVVKFKNILAEKNIKIYETDCPRNIFAIGRMARTYRQLKMIIDNNKYDIVHTQSPIGGVVCRLAAKRTRKKGTKVIYTAHGFHFFKGASILSWLVFYPIEKYLSRWTDILITINHEDYELAKKRFHCKNVEYIPGVGVDANTFKGCTISKNEKRMELGIPSDAFVLFSVGEVNENKNHQLVINAIKKIDNPSIHYLIAGIGDKMDDLRRFANELGIGKQIHFLGYRKDIPQILQAADLFAFPSIREGLGLAAVEALACGVPVVGMNTRGIREYVIEGKTGYLFDNNVESCVKSILSFYYMNLDDRNKMKVCCRKKAAEYSAEVSEHVMRETYISCGGSRP